MMSVRVHGEVDISIEELNEDRMPVLVVQQAAQGETDRAVSGGQLSFTLEEKKNNSTIILSLKKRKKSSFWGHQSLSW